MTKKKYLASVSEAPSGSVFWQQTDLLLVIFKGLELYQFSGLFFFFKNNNNPELRGSSLNMIIYPKKYNCAHEKAYLALYTPV